MKYMWSMLNFQDYNSFLMVWMSEFHDLTLLILLVIMLFIGYILFNFIMNNFVNINILHNHTIEIIWTMIPVFILMFMVVPSLKILYIIEDVYNCMLTVKILGHQWYWSYEFCDVINVEFESFMLTNWSVENGLFRLLDVDNRLILPFHQNIRGLVSSFDVIHSWAMPSIGAKIDAVPGRINQFIMRLDRSGVYFGQCSEICGLNHSFMPIVIESIWIKLWIDLVIGRVVKSY